ncbi:DNA-binding CsgD family transcriptional regulator [Aminobacter niigataensis]|uniref:DNA-binding CsgD family transcriptional regulator n=2 Tax=Aminobacter niigataensis TaxID=83265 RepID=A0ABR6L7S5_9HYPH|nr:helix-turn-helix transcriptional regulator [Aminobacter niigataensis]MBB4652853.1 DNA-binding CsgD family transcriptional regulator [Aminobacter niigataensis]
MGTSGVRVAFFRPSEVIFDPVQAPAFSGLKWILAKYRMTALAARNEQTTVAARLASRSDLTAFFMNMTDEIGADGYMLVAIPQDQDRDNLQIIASNWIYDAIQIAGHALIAGLAQSPFASAPGVRPQSLIAAQAPAVLGGEEARLLDVLGHAEIFALRLHVGRQRLFVLFSAAEAGRIDPAAMPRTQLECCYALSQAPAILAAATMRDPLSDRERECLFWVSEGKTTDEVALILGVSSNTVNSYITHAIQKLSASNRAMAIATAIRSGII